MLRSKYSQQPDKAIAFFLFVCCCCCCYLLFAFCCCCFSAALNKSIILPFYCIFWNLVYFLLLSTLKLSQISNVLSLMRTTPAGNYMFKVNNRKTRTKSEICSKLIVNFEHISHLVLVFLLLTLSRKKPAGTNMIRRKTGHDMKLVPRCN